MEFAVGGSVVGSGACVPRQGTNVACAWGVSGGGLVMCRCVFALSGDRLSWTYGNSNYYAFTLRLGEPLVYADGLASTVTRISAA